MSPTTRARLLDVCQQQVIGFQCGDYVLSYDLDWLDRLHRQEAVEGVILHATRILEVLSRQALGLADRPENKLLEIINELQHYRQMPGRLRNCLHELRRLGNDARHVLRTLNREEAELAYVIIIHWLAWFFCENPGGLKLRCLLIHNQPLDTLLPARLAGLMKQLDDTTLDDPHFVASLDLGAADCPVLLSPVLPALLVEGLLEREHYQAAGKLLDAATRRFNRDLRLRQLRGLYHSSLGELEQARRMLENTPRTGTAADEETLGILAGVYKRLWEKDPGDLKSLSRSHALYRDEWDRSGRTNTYLGINAAATALWQEQLVEARDMAAAVVELLKARREHLTHLPGGVVCLNYWDEATLAEAYLLLGEKKEADSSYLAAFERFPQQKRSHARTRDQGRRNLKYLKENLDDYPYLKEV